MHSPQFATLEKDDIPQLKLKNLKFPVICKTFQSCGTTESHEMAVVLRLEAFSSLKLRKPLLIQEFVNHGGVLFKVFVIGTKYQIVKRPSVPDLNPLRK